MKTKTEHKNTNQVTGNIGMYYVCYFLSKIGWNAMPTSRNAKGIDILIYNNDASKKISLQVKSLSKRNPVPLGTSLNNLFADFIIVCTNVYSEKPSCFILTPSEIEQLARKREKDKRVSFWLNPKDYSQDKFHEAWDKIK